MTRNAVATNRSLGWSTCQRSCAVVLVIVALILTPDPFFGSDGASVNGVSCMPCHETKCSDYWQTTNCPIGVVRDPCDCCDVCARNIQEPCGGTWGVYGICAQGLECVVESEYPWGHGVCQEGKSTNPQRRNSDDSDENNNFEAGVYVVSYPHTQEYESLNPYENDPVDKET